MSPTTTRPRGAQDTAKDAAKDAGKDASRNAAKDGGREQKRAGRDGQSDGAAAPRPLAVRTDLSAEQSRRVADAVNPLIADAIALWVKLKNYHWHLSGLHFRDFHLMFDEFAANVLESVDIMAERVRRVGGTTLRSVRHVSALQTIPDDDEAFVPAMEMIRRLLDDEERMAEAIRKAIEECEDAKDEPTANRLEEILDEIERQKWFLFEIQQEDAVGDVEKRGAAPTEG